MGRSERGYDAENRKEKETKTGCVQTGKLTTAAAYQPSGARRSDVGNTEGCPLMSAI
jgi:hypothetical protein